MRMRVFFYNIRKVETKRQHHRAREREEKSAARHFINFHSSFHPIPYNRHGHEPRRSGKY